jgi:hypothetical protein
MRKDTNWFVYVRTEVLRKDTNWFVCVEERVNRHLVLSQLPLVLIPFSDEAQFSQDGMRNSQNSHLRAADYHRGTVE